MFIILIEKTYDWLSTGHPHVLHDLRQAYAAENEVVDDGKMVRAESLDG